MMSGSGIESVSAFFKVFEGWHLTVQRSNGAIYAGVYLPEQRGAGRRHPLGLFELTLVKDDGEVHYVTVPVDFTEFRSRMDYQSYVFQWGDGAQRVRIEVRAS